MSTPRPVPLDPSIKVPGTGPSAIVTGGCDARHKKIYMRWQRPVRRKFSGHRRSSTTFAPPGDLNRLSMNATRNEAYFDCRI